MADAACMQCGAVPTMIHTATGFLYCDACARENGAGSVPSGWAAWKGSNRG